MSQDAGGTLVGSDERGQDLDCGGFAGAVVPEQGEDFTLANAEVHAFEHELVAAGFAQACGGQRDACPGKCCGGHATMLEA